MISVDGEIAGSPGDARTAQLARQLGATVVVGVVERQGPGFLNTAGDGVNVESSAREPAVAQPRPRPVDGPDQGTDRARAGTSHGTTRT